MRVVPNRREFLLTAAASGLAAAWPRAAAAIESVPRKLVARPGRASLLGDGQPQTAIWGFEGTAPGPVLRVRQGEELAVTFINDLPEGSAVHWHGIRNINGMD